MQNQSLRNEVILAGAPLIPCKHRMKVLIYVLLFGFSSGATTMSFADTGISGANLKCGPDLTGQEFIWIDTNAKQIWINKEDNATTAIALSTTSWNQNQTFSLQATATMSALNATYAFSLAPLSEYRGSMVVTLTAAGNSSLKLAPVQCAGLNR
jgi:hypothetical protein